MLPIRISGSWCRRHCRPAPAMANWRGLPLPISIPTSVPFRSSTVKSGKPRHVVLTDEGVQFFRRLCAGRAGDEIMLRKMSAAESGKIRLEESKKIAKEKSENSDDMRTLLRPRSRMLLKGDEGGLGGHYPLGHLRRGGGSISALRVTGDPAKGDPGGEDAPTPPPTPLIYWGDLSAPGDGAITLA